MDMVAKLVREFHQAFHLPIGDTTQTHNQLRADLIREEADEAADAIESGDLPAIAKELADLVIVAYGAALTLGIDLDAAVYVVHRSNMTKLDDNGQPIMRADGKVLKGPNYQPPDFTGGR
jgi:predicted HAD superfamily Cof-like phosphohydrolase